MFEEVGTRKTVFEQGDFKIVRIVTGHRYPRSGNFHNPTPEIRWDAFQGERLVDTGYTYRPMKKFWVKELKKTK